MYYAHNHNPKIYPSRELYKIIEVSCTWIWDLELELDNYSPAFIAIPVRRHREAEEAARLPAVHHAVARVQVKAGHAGDPEEGGEEAEAGHQVAHDEAWSQGHDGVTKHRAADVLTLSHNVDLDQSRISASVAAGQLPALNSSLCQKRKLRLR